jgi:hypothetical protein
MRRLFCRERFEAPTRRAGLSRKEIIVYIVPPPACRWAGTLSTRRGLRGTCRLQSLTTYGTKTIFWVNPVGNSSAPPFLTGWRKEVKEYGMGVDEHEPF